MLVFVFVLAFLFQDLALPQEAFGRLGSNAVLFLLPLFLIIAYRYNNRRGVLPFNKNVKQFVVGVFFFIIITTFITLVNLPFLPYVAKGEVLWLKALKLEITIGIWPLLIYVSAYLYQKWPRRFMQAIVLLQFLIVIILIVEKFWNPSIFSQSGFFHLFDNFNMRPRLFTPEASIAGTFFADISLVGLILPMSRRYKMYLFVSLILALVLIESKGTILALIISICLAYSLKFLRLKAQNRMALLLVLFVLALLIPSVILQIKSDYENYTSAATRTVFALSSWFAINANPIGQGVSSYLVYQNKWLTQSIQVVRDIFPEFSFREVLGNIAQEGDYAIFPKDLPSVLIWMSSFVGVIAYLALFKLLLSTGMRSEFWGTTAAFFILVASFTNSFLYQYDAALLLSVIFIEQAKLNVRSSLRR